MIRLKHYQFSQEGSRTRENLLINPDHITMIDMSIEGMLCLKMISFEREILVTVRESPIELIKIVNKAYDDSL